MAIKSHEDKIEPATAEGRKTPEEYPHTPQEDLTLTVFHDRMNLADPSECSQKDIIAGIFDLATRYKEDSHER
jgi:hypothetical protein